MACAESFANRKIYSSISKDRSWSGIHDTWKNIYSLEIAEGVFAIAEQIVSIDRPSLALHGEILKLEARRIMVGSSFHPFTAMTIPAGVNLPTRLAVQLFQYKRQDLVLRMFLLKMTNKHNLEE
jgi:hypothetical protein